jgi:hypothetical protein
MEEVAKEMKREKRNVIIIAIILIGGIIIVGHVLSESLIKEENCDVCIADYLQPQCQTIACEPVVNALKF